MSITIAKANAVRAAVSHALPAAADDDAGERADVGFIARPVDLSNLATREFPPLRYVADLILPRGEVTILAAHGGAGKSILAETLCAHVATGRKWGPFSTVAGKAVFVSLEDGAGTLGTRLQRICRAYDLDPDAVAHGLNILDCSCGSTTALATEVYVDGIRRLSVTTLGMETLREAAHGVDLLVIDNASDAFDGNENERRQVRAFMHALREIARAEDAAVLLLAHIDKSSAKYGSAGNTYSGSTAWHNSARSRLALVSEDGSIRLVHEKANNSRAADNVPLRWTDDGVLMPANTEQARAAAQAAGAEDDAVVLAAVGAAIARGITVSASASGSNTAWHAIASLPELPPELQRPKDGKRRVLLAVARLESAGALRRETYRDSFRHDKQRLALPQNAAAAAAESAAAAVPHTPCTTAAAGAAARAVVVPRAAVPHCRSTAALPHRDGSPSVDPPDWRADAGPEIRAKLAEMGAKDAGHE